MHEVFKLKLGNVFGDDDPPSAGMDGYRLILMEPPMFREEK